MITRKNFAYIPEDSEAEQASNSYLMSLVAVMAALPLPIINLIATLAFYISNRKSSYFVRWHCIQALASQVTFVGINAYAFWHLLFTVLGYEQITNKFIGYLLTVILFNIIEFVMIIYAAINTRKGHHVFFFFWGDLTNLLCREKI